MDLWPYSDILHARMETLITKGLLHGRIEENEWLISGDEDASASPDGYVISFIPFHERRLVVPPHRFL
jgi:hypothetical protein